MSLFQFGLKSICLMRGLSWVCVLIWKVFRQIFYRSEDVLPTGIVKKLNIYAKINVF